MSNTSRSSVPGSAALRCRCDRRAVQLVSRCAFRRTNVESKLIAGPQKPRDWAAARAPFRGQALGKFPGSVTPAARAEPFVSRDGFLSQVIGQLDQLIDVFSTGPVS